MELNTMTIDHSYGMQNPELEWLEKKLRDTLSEITDEYMKDCFDNNMETLSADGAFMWMVFQCLTESRLKYAYREKQEKSKSL